MFNSNDMTVCKDTHVNQQKNTSPGGAIIIILASHCTTSLDSKFPLTTLCLKTNRVAALKGLDESVSHEITTAVLLTAILPTAVLTTALITTAVLLTARLPTAPCSTAVLALQQHSPMLLKYYHYQH